MTMKGPKTAEGFTFIEANAVEISFKHNYNRECHIKGRVVESIDENNVIIETDPIKVPSEFESNMIIPTEFKSLWKKFQNYPAKEGVAFVDGIAKETLSRIRNYAVKK